jgi:hypothetical protein
LANTSSTLLNYSQEAGYLYLILDIRENVLSFSPYGHVAFITSRCDPCIPSFFSLFFMKECGILLMHC